MQQTLQAPRLAVPLPRGTPFGSIVSLLRRQLGLLIEDCVNARAWPGGSLRVLETGSTGGILSALLLETEMALRVKSIDFADPFPPTLELAVERAIGWNRRCQFINASLATLPVEPRYDVVLACSAFQTAPQTADLAEMIAHRQPTCGVFFHLHETLDPAHLTYHLFQYDRIGRRSYASSANDNSRRFSAAWVRRWSEPRELPRDAKQIVRQPRVW